MNKGMIASVIQCLITFEDFVEQVIKGQHKSIALKYL